VLAVKGRSTGSAAAAMILTRPAARSPAVNYISVSEAMTEMSLAAAENKSQRPPAVKQPPNWQKLHTLADNRRMDWQSRQNRRDKAKWGRLAPQARAQSANTMNSFGLGRIDCGVWRRDLASINGGRGYAYDGKVWRDRTTYVDSDTFFGRDKSTLASLRSVPLNLSAADFPPEPPGLGSFEKKAWQAFCAADMDGSGTISMRELFRALDSAGVIGTHKEKRDWFMEEDQDNSGQIDWPEFLRLMRRFRKMGKVRASSASARIGGSTL